METTSTAAAAAAPGGAPTSVDDNLLQKTIISRLVKQTIAKDKMLVSSEVVAALTHSATIFIHYLTAAANDTAKAAGRKNFGATDIFQALEDLELDELVQPLKDFQEVMNKRGWKITSGRGRTKLNKGEASAGAPQNDNEGEDNENDEDEPEEPEEPEEDEHQGSDSEGDQLKADDASKKKAKGKEKVIERPESDVDMSG